MRAATTAATQSVSAERLRLAVHESGHGVMAVLLGHRCQGLKLNGSRSGVAFSRCPEHNENDRIGGSLLLLDRSVRDRVESDIVISLAGPLAADNWAPPTTNYTADATSIELERITRELKDDPVFQERVADWDATPPLERQSDVDSVSEAAFLWCGSASAAARFAGWLYNETEALVRSRDFQRPLAAVTRALLAHGALPGAEVERLVLANDRYRLRKEIEDGGNEPGDLLKSVTGAAALSVRGGTHGDDVTA